MSAERLHKTNRFVLLRILYFIEWTVFCMHIAQSINLSKTKQQRQAYNVLWEWTKSKGGIFAQLNIG